MKKLPTIVAVAGLLVTSDVFAQVRAVGEAAAAAKSAGAAAAIGAGAKAGAGVKGAATAGGALGAAVTKGKPTTKAKTEGERFGRGQTKSRAEVIVFETATLCEFSINGVKITRSTIIGYRDTVVALLERSAVFQTHDCAYLLSSHPADVSEVAWTIERHAKPLGAAGEQATIAKTRVRLQVAEPGEFVAVAKSLRSGDGGRGDGHGPVKRGATPTDLACDVGSEICVSSDGELSLELSCGDLTVGVSTKGAVDIGLKNAAGEASLSLGVSK